MGDGGQNISAKSAISAISPLFLRRLAGRLRIGCRSGTLLLRRSGDKRDDRSALSTTAWLTSRS